MSHFSETIVEDALEECESDFFITAVYTTSFVINFFDYRFPFFGNIHFFAEHNLIYCQLPKLIPKDISTRDIFGFSMESEQNSEHVLQNKIISENLKPARKYFC